MKYFLYDGLDSLFTNVITLINAVA